MSTVEKDVLEKDAVEKDDLQLIWNTVRAWPQPKRVSLASKILRSLEAENERPKKSLRDIVGLWSDMPPITDDDVKRIIEEELTKKYG